MELVKVGRLAKLFVGPLTDGLKQLTIRTLNTRRFTFDVASQLDLLVAQTQIQVDSTHLALPVLPADASTILTFYRPTRSSPWTVLSDSDANALPNVRRYGPALSILTTSGPLVLIVPSHSTRHQRIARSIAQDAWVYGRLDARIVTDADVEVEMGRGAWDGLQGNWIVVGGRENRMNELLRSTPRTCLLQSCPWRRFLTFTIATFSSLSRGRPHQHCDARRKAHIRPNEPPFDRCHRPSPSSFQPQGPRSHTRRHRCWRSRARVQALPRQK